jgi:hypothetical protein
MTRKHFVSEGAAIEVGLSKVPNRVDFSLPSSEDGNSFLLLALSNGPNRADFSLPHQRTVSETLGVLVI